MKKAIVILLAGLVLGGMGATANAGTKRSQFTTLYYHMPAYGTAVGIGAEKAYVARYMFSALTKNLGLQGHRQTTKPALPARCAWSTYVEGSTVIFAFYSRTAYMGRVMCKKFGSILNAEGWDREL